MVKVVKNFVKVNQYTRPGFKLSGVKGIVMHWTATPGATALNERNYFNGTCIADKRYASAHYFVDRNEAQYIIPENEMAYHAHDQNRCFVSFLKPNANQTSISVEMCVEKNGTIHDETVQNAAELVADLCKRFKLSTDKIVCHYDVTNKNCPAPWVSDSSKLAAFRKKVDGLLGNKTVSNSTASSSKGSSSSTAASGSLKSKVNGLRFYSKPSWEDKDVVGTVNKGIGFPTVVEKVKVGSAYQYKVKNSKGATYYITASDKYVKVSGKVKTASSPSKSTASKSSSGSSSIKSVGKIKIVGVSNAAIVMDKPDRNNSKNIGTVKLGSKIDISGSVKGKNNSKGYWEVIYKGKRGYISGQFGSRV
ncbi:N-acetylmuramoyl-L-alanine amidase [Bacillus swezeyi]|uniref:N-acetylmuramoyl-L-alanine amidase n=2 Tax=Bacillus swezeyi TaxID=1925020 RepID=A0A1R1RHK1_9BACI|nr:N-acetylmuramoyl-L-alanine amidase [Bacillus swezeyi]MEC1259999.1 N-acetylmuramoyl-L-alanine amidase [Bacillus swezeyi]MED2929769.1 N-acetylmuramoyl-L-alanine amidase [Bacillus swezeyi]MED2963204.1 N-acetylmuramoyl-L-alanine amidase [Bacillus swezeyi]MED3073155.1 N-acetylmuramoyl-L-alanine amidase [Bacillus swezeyi]MED3082766.1 N-acetylmuramoyl-L-alanine amidase [Bacillus swezeyi]